jgi:hypothetical protein
MQGNNNDPLMHANIMQKKKKKELPYLQLQEQQQQ